MAGNKGGRPPHEPTESTRRQVKALAAYGIPQDEIGRVIGVSKPTLEKHYRDELDRAEVEANAKVAESLFSSRGVL
jgi:DNA invertase Pin-like site-specific DNA recombinase